MKAGYFKQQKSGIMPLPTLDPFKMLVFSLEVV